ncbi:ribosome small subunit-dependent GTPase A [Micromonospora olivasterospora]|uniref:Ribosome small subunit-dependent GTPase A n=1 Tax=Micromonospora olivasterospora TaxID=1880 RepID=A0A562I3D1_MICOL|nr:ribosome small subunit-dependent GTPase A [Micromonospora olivasterospora]
MTIDLTDLGWDAERAVHVRRRTDQRPGRVARVDRGVCTVLDADGPVRATLGAAVLAAAARDLTRLPCAGDWVLLRTWPDGPVTVEAVLPRRTALVRRTAGKDASGQVLAANLDAAAVVEPVHPEPDVARIERLLSLAHESGATPLVVLTKADLAADPAAIARQLAGVAPGVPVLPVSAERGVGLDPLREWVAPGRTLGLLGPSGAGKSSLVNALAGAVVMPTQAIRRVDGKGRHTTTWRALVPVPGGARCWTPRGYGRSACSTARPGWTGPSPTSPSWPPAAGTPTARTRRSRAARSSTPWPRASSASAGTTTGASCSARWRTRPGAGRPGRPRNAGAAGAAGGAAPPAPDAKIERRRRPAPPRVAGASSKIWTTSRRLWPWCVGRPQFPGNCADLDRVARRTRSPDDAGEASGRRRRAHLVGPPSVTGAGAARVGLGPARPG